MPPETTTSLRPFAVNGAFASADRALSDKMAPLFSGNVGHILLKGECLSVMSSMPSGVVDCIITSPPYWKMREYEIGETRGVGIIGAEDSPGEYVANLVDVFSEARRVLSDRGSLWLNLGDKYVNKNLMGMPWRVALAMREMDGWILRNAIVWDKVKGTQSVCDRMRDCYEHIFHFVKRPKYYFAADDVRIPPRGRPAQVNGKTVSATGVSGARYRTQIQKSAELSPNEKRAALAALDGAIAQMRDGTIVDFRMTIRGQQRIYHSDRKKVSGRAKELADKGFFIMRIGSGGFLPTDIWRIVPEDKAREDAHYAVFPEALLERPIKATCPPNGIVLDPFSGTGSAVAAAVRAGRRGIGIELSGAYHKTAQNRLRRITSRQGAKEPCPSPL